METTNNQDQYFSNYRTQSAVGEFDPDYLLFPYTAERIAETLGADIKILVVLRLINFLKKLSIGFFLLS